MKTKKYVEYMVEETKKILAIDSPSGYTADVADYVMKAYQKLGYEPKLTTKGGVLVALGGKDKKNAVMLEAHIDTLGAMVAEIKSNGRLRVTPVGGMNANNAEAENCRIHTRFGEKVYEGTLQLANAYMSQLGRSINELQAKKLTDKKVLAMIDSLYPVSEDLSEMQKKNNLKQQETLKACYFDAPDLQGVGKNGYRFINAVSDMAYHGKPLRQTKNYNENLFRKTIDGLPVLDKTYQMLLSV